MNTYKVPEDATSFARYDMNVYQLHDGTWVAQPVHWPMVEARSIDRHVAIVGCCELIEAECARDRPEDCGPSCEKREYLDAGDTGTIAGDGVIHKTWRTIRE